MLVGDAAHGFKVVARLELSAGNKNAIAGSCGERRAAGGVARVRQVRSVLLHQLVGDVIAREFMAANQREMVFGRELPLKAQRKISRRAVVGVVFRDHGIQIMARHVAGRAQAQCISFPCVLVLSVDSTRIVAASQQCELTVHSRYFVLRVLTTTTPPILRPYWAGIPAV